MAERAHRTIRFSFTTLAILLAILAANFAAAGEVQLAWDPADTAQGYKIYKGTSPGAYGTPATVGNVTTAPATGLTDCTMWYFAVTAFNAAGESAPSTEISTWPRAVLTSANPAVLVRGTQAAVAIGGVNFGPGDVVTLSNPGVQINSVTLNSCQQLTLNLSVGASAALGPVNVVVTHPSGVAGTGTALLNVQPVTPPTVVATSPSDGASDVSLTVQPTVQFSEAVGGVSSSTVRLLNAQGAAVAQAPGSPALSAGGTVATIDPASDLASGQTYRIQVVGGAGGVVDLDGNPLATTYTQPTGFTTVADATGPEVSALEATDVTGTSAVIQWTTNEPADSRVFYRKLGATLYTTVAETADVTAHSVALTGLEPETTYEFHVGSTDAEDNTTTTSPDEEFTTTTSPWAYLRFEVESGVLVAPVAVASGAGAFDGAWVQTPAGSAQGSATAPNGTATGGILLPESGPWFLWVRMYADGGSSNSWFESIDGAARQSISTSVYGAWSWIEGRTYDLVAGLHSVELGGREGGARADRVLLTNDPDFVPSELPDSDVTATGPVTAFTATPASGRIDLAWTSPVAGDLASVVIRYRTDGQYPTSPVDGFPLVNASAASGAADTHAHTDVDPGTPYHYSAFAVDEAGNVSAPAHAQGTLAGAPPPPQNVTVF
jgi:hypothetical protein